MDNVKTLEEYLLEGLNTSVEVTNDPEDEVTISLPNDESETKYIRRNGKIYVIGENGEEEFSENDPNYEYINKIFKSTRFAKNQDKRNQVERISGKDDEIEDDVEKLYDEDIKDPSTSIIRSDDTIMEFIKKSFKDNEVCAYIPLENITDIEREWFSKNIKTVGKGEYLLPIIFSDIRKNHPYKEKGDDVITDKSGKDTLIHIEVKTAKNEIPFIVINDNELPDELKGSENEIKYQYRCAYSIGHYLIGRNFQDSKPSYMVLFDNDSETKDNFSGIFIIKCDIPTKSLEKKRLDDDVKSFAMELYNDIKIDNKNRTSHKEKLSLLCKNKKLLCILPLDDFKDCFSDWSTKINTRSKEASLSPDDIKKIKTELSADNNYKDISKKYDKLRYIYFKYYKEYPNLNKFDIYSLLGIEGKDTGIDNEVGYCKKFIKNDVPSKYKTIGKSKSEKEIALGFPHNKGVLYPMCLMYELATGKKILEQHILSFDEMFND